MQQGEDMGARAFSAVFAAAVIVLTSAPASAEPAAVRQRLGGPEGVGYCDGSGVWGNEQPAPVWATIVQDAKQVKAIIQLRGATANTSYLLRLIQGAVDCRSFDATVTTNASGNATIIVSELRSPEQTTVLIVVDTGEAYGLPTYISQPVGVRTPPREAHQATNSR
jgi:hypothetical protein